MTRCERCDMPMHRYGFPTDADGHEPSETACFNSMRAALDDALDFVRRCANEDFRGNRPWYVGEAQAVLLRHMGVRTS